MATSTHDRAERPEGSYAWIYLWELHTPEYRALTVLERALLLELRALYLPSKGDKVSLTVREATRKLGVSQRRVRHALRVLDARGWIKEVKSGSGGSRTFLLIGPNPEQ